jgi:uncharacterized protein (DUF302 family)
VVMYGFNKEVAGDFDEVIDKVVEALKTEGFGIVSEIDVKTTLKNKIDVDRLPYKILGACNPKLADQAINFEPDIGLLLPCNVVVRQTDDGKNIVCFMDPLAVLGLVNREEIKPMAEDVKGRLQRVCDAL